MARFSDFMNNNMNKFKQVYIRYTLSILCVFIIAVVQVISNISDVNNKYIADICSICSIWFVGNFLIESLWKKNNKNKYKLLIGYCVTLVIAVFFYVLNDVQYKDIKQMILGYVYIFYILGAILFAVYVLICQQEIDLTKITGRIIFGLLRAFGAFLIINTAFILILGIIKSLLIDFKMCDVEENIQIMLTALIYIPTCLLIISDTRDDNASFTKKFVSYVLMPCVWIAMVVIYLYMIKIFVKHEIPNNEIFEICARLFTFGMPIWMMTSGFLEEKSSVYYKLVNITKYIYSPFIILESYAIILRINSYGLTEERYAAIMFIILQIVYILWEKIYVTYKKQKGIWNDKDTNLRYENLIIVLIACVFIYLLCPYINAKYMSYLSQKNRLEENMTVDIAEASEAYKYLTFNPYGERYIDNYLSKDDIEKLESQDSYIKDVNTWDYISCYYNPLENEGLSIEGNYKKIYEVSENSYNEQSIEDVSIYVGEKNEEIKLKDCILYYDNLTEEKYNLTQKEKIYEIEISDNEKIIITYIYFYINKDKDLVKKLSIRGYLLTK